MKKVINITIIMLLLVFSESKSQSIDTGVIISDTITDGQMPISELVQDETLSSSSMGLAAEKAYLNGDYTGAIQIYESLLEGGKESAALYYNLGNCYYKVGQIARAILNYERSLLLDPSDSDVLFNLELAKNKTVDRLTPMRELFFITWAKNIASLCSSDAWAICSIIAFFLLFVFLSLYLFFHKLLWRKIGLLGALFTLFFCLIANICASYQKDKLQERNYAIVIVPTVTARSTPDRGGTELFVLHEGIKVKLKDVSMREWKEILLEDGNVGWIPSAAIEEI